MECNRAAVVQKRNLEQRKFDCFGPCQRKQLGHKEFTGAMLLRTEVKRWLCRACQFPHCDVCGVLSDEAVPFGPEDNKKMQKTTDYRRRWICEWCLYPPCGGCGLQRTRASKKQDVQFQLWFCRECFWKSTKRTKQEHPPCSSCGAKKGFLEKRARFSWEKREAETAKQKKEEGEKYHKKDFPSRLDIHAHKAWDCSACWRKRNRKTD